MGELELRKATLDTHLSGPNWIVYGTCAKLIQQGPQEMYVALVTLQNELVGVSEPQWAWEAPETWPVCSSMVTKYKGSHHS